MKLGASLALVCAAGAALGQNLANPGYEAGSLTGWLGGGSAQATQETARSGAWSARNPGAWSSVFQTVTGLAPNWKYRVSVWARLASGTTANNQSIYVSLDGGTTKTRQFVKSAAWTQFVFDFTTTSAGSVTIGNEELNGSATVCFLDDWLVKNTDPILPPAPTNLAAGPGDRRIALGWNPLPNVQSYVIERAPSWAGPWAVVGSTRSPWFTATGLTNGTSYTFRVAARNGDGRGAWSTLVAATPRLGAPLSPGVTTLGLNLASAHDWGRDRTWADAARSARSFAPIDNWNASTTLDANGWPTTDACSILIEAYPAGGTYKLSFTGQADLEPASWKPAAIANKTYDAASNTTRADVVVPNNADGIWLYFRNTKRTSTSAVNTGFTNLKLIRPGHSAADTFNRRLPLLLEPYEFLRFMDLGGTNSNSQVEWADRTKPTDAIQSPAHSTYGWQGKGVAWEHMIQLANDTDKDAWICVPAKASNDYVRRLAELWRDNLEPQRKLYVEFSNEVWNWGGAFRQSSDNRTAAVAEASVSGSPLRYDGTNDEGLWVARRVAKRGKEISDIFRSVFGDSAMMSRVRPILCSQLGWSDYWLSEGLRFMDAYYNNGEGNFVSVPRPPSYYFWGGGGSGYNVGFGHRDNLTLDQVFTVGYANSWPAFYEAVAADTHWLTTYGLRRIAYEAGPGLDADGHSDNVKEPAQFDPRIADVIRTQLRVWQEAGGTHFGVFNSVGNLTHGLLHDIDDNFVSSPKLQTLNSLAGTAAAAPTVGIALEPGTLRTVRGGRWNVRRAGWGTSVAGAADAAQVFEPGDWHAYTVRALRDGRHFLRLEASTSVATSMELFVDGVKVGTFAIPNYSGGSGLTPSLVINLTPGLHSIRLRASSGRTTVNALRFNG